METPLGKFPAKDLEEGANAVLCVRQTDVRLVPRGKGKEAQVPRVVRQEIF